jgi:hypothetical protein
MNNFLSGHKMKHTDNNKPGSRIGNEATSGKGTTCKKYDQNISSGFTSTDADGEERSICLPRTQILAVGRMGPKKLKNHLKTVHVKFIRKTSDLFTAN